MRSELETKSYTLKTVYGNYRLESTCFFLPSRTEANARLTTPVTGSGVQPCLEAAEAAEAAELAELRAQVAVEAPDLALQLTSPSYQ